MAVSVIMKAIPIGAILLVLFLFPGAITILMNPIGILALVLILFVWWSQ